MRLEIDIKRVIREESLILVEILYKREQLDFNNEKFHLLEVQLQDLKKFKPEEDEYQEEIVCLVDLLYNKEFNFKMMIQ